MAFTGARDAVFKIDDKDDVLTDLSGYLTSITAPSFDAQVAEVSVFSNRWKQYVRTQIDPGTMSLEGVFDPVVGTLLHNLGTAEARDFEYYPQGTAAGAPKFSGSAFITTYSVPADRDDAVLFSAEFQVTGTLTAGTA